MPVQHRRDRLFAGELALAIHVDRAGRIVFRIGARLAAIEDPEADAAEVDAAAAGLRDQLADDLMVQFVRGLRHQYGVDVQPDVLDRYYAVNY